MTPGGICDPGLDRRTEACGRILGSLCVTVPNWAALHKAARNLFSMLLRNSPRHPAAIINAAKVLNPREIGCLHRCVPLTGASTRGIRT